MVMTAAKVALARTPRVPLRAWQPSVESGRRWGLFPLTRNLPITIHALIAREKDSPAVAPLRLQEKKRTGVEKVVYSRQEEGLNLLNGNRRKD